MRATRQALELWPEGQDEDARLRALDRLGQCTELAGDLGGATVAWREVADARRSRGDPAGLAEVDRRLAAALELQGRWQEALATREQAADAFGR